MNQDLRQEDKDILKSLNHTLIETPKVAMPETEMDLERELPPKAATKKPVAKEPEANVENRVLTQLRQTFGLEKIKTTDVIFNNMVFTLKAISAAWLSWSDSYALLAVVDKAGNFNRLEYESAFKVYLAAGYIEKIDGLPVTEVFGNSDEKVARFKLANFLMNESSDILGKKLFEAYDAEIEPYAKVVSGLTKEDDSMEAYECTKCGHIMSHEKRKETYFCHKDGAKMRRYKLEANLPLP